MKFIATTCAALFCCVAGAQNSESTPKKYAIYGERPASGGKIAIKTSRTVSTPKKVIESAVILVENGIVKKVIKAADAGELDGYSVHDFSQFIALPGFVDLHSHVGGSGDINDMIFQVNPDLQVLDAVLPENERLKDAIAGGVTSILFIPGSGTNMGGWGVLMKCAGKTRKESVIRFPGALKIAQAGNPERPADLGGTRMGMNWMIDNILEQGLDYHKKLTSFESGKGEAPKKDARFELMRGLFEREYPTVVHTQQFQVFQSTMRILHDKYKLWVVTDHSTFDSFYNAPQVLDFLKEKDSKFFIICGPRSYWRNPDSGSVMGIAASWYERGIKRLGINTDAGVVPQEELPFQVTMNIRLGLPDNVALDGVTQFPAEAIGAAERIGTIEEGKDADIVLWTGDPFDPRSYVRAVFINGQLVYDISKDKRRF